MHPIQRVSNRARNSRVAADTAVPFVVLEGGTSPRRLGSARLFDEAATSHRKGRAAGSRVFVLASAIVHAVVASWILEVSQRPRTEERPEPSIEVTFMKIAHQRPPPPAGPPAAQTTPALRPKSALRKPQQTAMIARPELAPPVQPALEQQPVVAPLAEIAAGEGTPDGGLPGGVLGGAPGGVAGGVPGGVPGMSAEPPVIGPSYDAAYLHNPPPRYPAAARRLKLQGTSIIRVLVSPEGRAKSVAVDTGSGVQLLDDAAVEAVQQWSFVPARQGDKPIAAEVNVPVRFHLTGGAAVLPSTPSRVDFNEEEMTPPKLVGGPSLEYTPEALEQQVQGTMLVRCVLTVEGSVRTCHVLSGLPFMDDAVIATLQAQRYTPATENGAPLEVNYTFQLTLRLPR